MPLPTMPSKLGDLLSPDEYKAKARPAKSGKKAVADEAEGEHAHGSTLVRLPNSDAELTGVAIPLAAAPAVGDTAAASGSARAGNSRRAKATARGASVRAVNDADATSQRAARAAATGAATDAAQAAADATTSTTPRGRRRQTAALLRPAAPAHAEAADATAATPPTVTPTTVPSGASIAADAAATPSASATSASPATSASADSHGANRQAAPAVPVTPIASAAASAVRPGAATPAAPAQAGGADLSARTPTRRGRTGARNDAPAPVVARQVETTDHAAGASSTARDNARPTRPPAAARKLEETGKLFVLDTNVLLHDPTCLFRFEEHDVYLPMMTLEELDNNKKGMSEVARNARQVSRTLDQLVAGADVDMSAGIPLSRLGSREASGRLFFQTSLARIDPVEGLPQGKADNQILGVVSALTRDDERRQVVLVSKDINMRIKAHALGLPVEDYFNDQVLEDSDLLYTGVRALGADFWTRHAKGMESWQDTRSGTTFYRVTGPACASLLVNQFVYLEPHDGEPAFHAQVREINGRTALLQTLRDYGHGKNSVWGVTARNREQKFALSLLMNPEIDFVTLLGQAGTGKTLLALAAGLAQVLDDKRYNEIIVTRATVPVGEDIGFLPGTEEEKMQPWMGAFDDNLEVLQKTDDSAGDWGRAATHELIRSRLKVKSMSFMRGRTFVDKYLIIDEAQNLTPKQMKTLVTRAGPGTKIVCLGNIAQIDTPYLTEGSSGLSYVVDRFKGWAHGGHVTLARGERSRLADYASDAL